MSHARLAWFGLAVAVGTAVVSAQTSQQRPTFRSGVDVIEIDVSVVDGDGRPMTDLVPTEFTVAIDGEVRRVVQAQFVSLRPAEPDARLPDPELREIFVSSNVAQQRGRLIVIAVDEESILFGEGRHVMRAAGEFVDKLTPIDRVALMALPTGRYVDFTSDHDRIRREVDGMAGLGQRVRRDINIGLYEAFQIAEYRDADLQDEVTTRECGPLERLDVSCASMVLIESRSIVQEVRYHAINSRRALEAILRALRDFEGPKALVWISGGFVIAREASFLREIEDLAAASRTTVYVIKVDEPQIDTTEASAPPTPLEDARMREAGLQAITAITRGDILRARYNPGPLFDRLEAELSGYYLLGVEARPTDRDEERRAIKVSVRRAGARVRARREVRFTPERDADQSVDARLARMLRSPVATTELPLRVATYAYPEGERVRVMIAMEIGREVDATAEVTLGYALRDPEGTVVSSRKQRITGTPAETPSGPVLEYSLPMTVAPGFYILRLAVVDGAGRSGSVEHRLVVGEMVDGSLVVGDLALVDRPESPGQFRPRVEARVSSGRLLVYTELYAESASVLERTEIYIEVANNESGPALASHTAAIGGPTNALRRFVTADVLVGHLPRGRYIVRARVMLDFTEVARLHRPFQISGP